MCLVICFATGSFGLLDCIHLCPFCSLSLKLSVGSGFMYGIVYFFSTASLYIRGSELYNEESWLQWRGGGNEESIITGKGKV